MITNYNLQYIIFTFIIMKYILKIEKLLRPIQEYLFMHLNILKFFKPNYWKFGSIKIFHGLIQCIIKHFSYYLYF